MVSIEQGFREQLVGGLLCCPFCGTDNITKAPMAPSVSRKGSQAPLARLAAAQADMLRKSRWVGDQFADTARAMHDGDVVPEQVHGSATIEQARSLIEDGIPVAPLPLPVVPPDQVN